MISFRPKNDSSFLAKTNAAARAWCISIYNPENGEIMGRSPLRFVLFLCSLAILYVVLSILTIAIVQLIGLYIQYVKPYPSRFLTTFPAILPLLDVYSFKYSCSGEKKNENIIKNITQKLATYSAEGNTCFDKKNEICTFSTSLLGTCGVTPFGFEDKKPCIYFQLGKVLSYLPHDSPSNADQNSENFLSFSCRYTDIKNPEVETIAIFPSKGISLSNMRGMTEDTISTFKSPIVSAKMDLKKGKEIECFFTDDKLPKSESNSNSEAYGKIKFSVDVEPNCNAP